MDEKIKLKQEQEDLKVTWTYLSNGTSFGILIPSHMTAGWT